MGPTDAHHPLTIFNCWAKWIGWTELLSSVHHGCAFEKGRAGADMARGGSLNTQPSWPLSGPHFNTIRRGELAEVEFDGLGTYHKLEDS